MINIFEKLRVWCIIKLGGYETQYNGSILGQKDGKIIIKVGKIENLHVDPHADGVFTVRSIYSNGYPKVRVDYFDKDYFPDLHVLSKEDLEE